MENFERPRSRPVKTVNVIPGFPVCIILGDDPIELVTTKGSYITSIILDPGRRAVKFFSKENGSCFWISKPGAYPIGADNFPDNFLLSGNRFTSRRHFCIDFNGFDSDGRARIRLSDLHSSNGTKIIIPETELSDVPASKSNAKIIGGGAEGKISSAAGDCAAITDKGLRANNEDAVMICDGLTAVADGIGGYEAGEKASHLALRILQKKSGQPITQELFKEICSELRLSGEIKGDSGCTLSVAKKSPSQTPGNVRLEVGNVGDSKAYVISLAEKKLIWESKDQSRIQKLLDRKILEDPIHRYSHPQNSVITNSINIHGLDEAAEIWQSDRPVLSLLVILCTDGVSDFVSPEEVTEIALRKRQFCTQEIVDLAIRRQENPFQIKLGGKLREVNIEAADNASSTAMLV